MALHCGFTAVAMVKEALGVLLLLIQYSYKAYFPRVGGRSISLPLRRRDLPTK